MKGERENRGEEKYISPRARRDRAELSSDFWLEDENPDEIIARDEATMARLGIDPGELARKMAWAVKLSRQEEHYCKTFAHGQFTISSAYYRMMVWCPLCSGEGGNGELVVIDNATGEELYFPSLMPHLVHTHRFFESPHSRYRVEPEQAARVLSQFVVPESFVYPTEKGK